MDDTPNLGQHAPRTRRLYRRSCTASTVGWLMVGIFCMLSIASVFTAVTSTRADGFGAAGNQWPGIWFTCEFAQRLRAPHDGCQMFDDEGFQLADGRLSYLRITHSDETACRGGKKGQCFRRDLSLIHI